MGLIAENAFVSSGLVFWHHWGDNLHVVRCRRGDNKVTCLQEGERRGYWILTITNSNHQRVSAQLYAERVGHICGGCGS